MSVMSDEPDSLFTNKSLPPGNIIGNARQIGRMAGAGFGSKHVGERRTNKDTDEHRRDSRRDGKN